MRDKVCIICGERLSGEPLMVLDQMPSSAQNIPDEQGLAGDHGITLALHQCPHCGLVEFDCEPVDYYRDVIRSGGFSTTMVELHRRQYEHLITAYHLEGKKFLEAGCGQGEFLSVLTAFPVRAYGIEHKADLVSLARSRGLDVWQQFTESEETVIKNPSGEGEGPYDVFLSFNFLEHQPDPAAMLRCLYRNLSEDGMGLITVPSLEYILEHDGYYELIRDHLAYYTFETLGRLLKRNGFQVLEEEMINRDTLSVIVKKGKQPFFLSETEEDICRVDVTGLKESRTAIEEEVNRLVEEVHRTHQTMAIWGASHQGFTLAATTGLGEKVRYMIDSAPFKQGRFAPASHIPITAPDYYETDPVDVILIVAPGYTDEIAGVIRERFGSQVQILTLRSNHIEQISIRS